MNNWNLMYDGSSPDGRGGAKYIGRTEGWEIARAFFDTRESNPYWTGYVEIITDDKIIRIRSSDVKAWDEFIKRIDKRVDELHD